MKRLMLLCFLLPVALLGVDHLKPLSESASRILRKDGEPELSELGYVGARSSALYNCTAAYLEEAGTQETTGSIVKEYRKKAAVFLIVALSAARQTQMSSEYFKQRVALLEEAYSKEMVENKKLNNSSISEFINADLTTAKEVFPIYEALASKRTTGGSVPAKD